MKKECVLEDKECILCGKCDICDLDENKICNNCGKCLETGKEYAELKIDEVILDY